MISKERYDYALKIQRLIHLAETDLQAFEKESGMEYSADKENKLREIFNTQNLGEIIARYKDEEELRQREESELQRQKHELFLAEKKAFDASLPGVSYKIFLVILKFLIVLQVCMHAFLQFLFFGAAVAGVVIYWMEHDSCGLQGVSINVVLVCSALLMLLAVFRVKGSYNADDATGIEYSTTYSPMVERTGRRVVSVCRLLLPTWLAVRHIVYCGVDILQTVAKLAFLMSVVMLDTYFLTAVAVAYLMVLATFDKMCREDKGEGVFSHLKEHACGLDVLMAKLVYSAVLLGGVYYLGTLDYHEGYIKMLEQVYVFLVNC